MLLFSLNSWGIFTLVIEFGLTLLLLFSFSTFKMSFHCCLASISDERSTVIWTALPLYILWLLSHSILIFSFRNSTFMCYTCFFLCLSCLRLSKLLTSVNLSFNKFQRFGTITFYLIFSFYLFSWYLNYMYVKLSDTVPQVSEALFLPIIFSDLSSN